MRNGINSVIYLLENVPVRHMHLCAGRQSRSVITSRLDKLALFSSSSTQLNREIAVLARYSLYPGTDFGYKVPLVLQH